jgi:GNAT superfamily N-acetyltransferase
VNDFLIRPIEPTDVAAVLDLVIELARYEREPDAVEMTADDLDRALFGPDPKLFGHVAVDRADGPGGTPVVGTALWFLNFSTWRGTHGIYLEDLIVHPAARRRGIGAALLATLAQVCTTRGYARFEWSVLDWNFPSIDFYRSLGAVGMDGWTTFRLTDDALRALAATAPEAGDATPVVPAH